MILIFESYWSTSNSGCLHCPPCFCFYLPCCRASRKPITNVKFKFVARQVEASVVIRAAKLKFVAERRTRVYFVQHVATTCNIVFCCETSCKLVTNVVIRATMCFNLQRNIVARQVEGKCCPYYRTFKHMATEIVKIKLYYLNIGIS